MAKLSDLKQDGSMKVLAYGESGAGKTIFATSFAGPMFVCDFDGKVVSAANFWKTHNPEKLDQIEYETYANIFGKDAKETTKLRFEAFHRWLYQAQESVRAGTFAYKTVVLDSLTTFADLLLLEVLRQTPSIKGPIPGRDDIPGMQHYGVNMIMFKDYVSRLLALPCNVVITAHIETEKDELTGALERRPKATGKLAAWLPIVFGEVYRSFVEEKDGKKRYLIQTQTDSKFNCRTQVTGLPPTVEANYKNLIK